MEKIREWQGWTSTQLQAHGYDRRHPSFDIPWLDARQEPWHRQGYQGAHFLTDRLIHSSTAGMGKLLSYSSLDEGGGRGSHTFFYRLSHTHLQQGWGSLSYSGLDEGGRGSEPVPQHPLVCYGSTMHLLVHVVMDGDAAENIKTVWAEARKEYVSLGIDRTNRFTNMHATMFKVTCLFFFHNRIALKGFVFNYTCLIRVCSSSWNLYSYHLFIYLSMYLFMYLSTHLSVNLRWLAYKLILHPEGERRVQAEGQSFWGALVWPCDPWDLEASPQRFAACASFDPEVPGV